jgi:hypothetical protein
VLPDGTNLIPIEAPCTWPLRSPCIITLNGHESSLTIRPLPKGLAVKAQSKVSTKRFSPVAHRSILLRGRFLLKRALLVICSLLSAMQLQAVQVGGEIVFELLAGLGRRLLLYNRWAEFHHLSG